VSAADAARPDDAATARWRSALANLEAAERRRAPDEVLRLLEESVIAARLVVMRGAQRAGALSNDDQRQFERDRELLRRFPSERGGTNGVGWFDWPVGSSPASSAPAPSAPTSTASASTASASTASASSASASTAGAGRPWTGTRSEPRTTRE
jgi:hypothetical protein